MSMLRMVEVTEETADDTAPETCGSGRWASRETGNGQPATGSGDVTPRGVASLPLQDRSGMMPAHHTSFTLISLRTVS